MKLESIQDIIKRSQKEEEVLGKIVYIEDNYIVIDVKNPFIFYYDIELSRINTPDKLLCWIFHLLGKNWMTTDILRKFIELISKHHNINIYGT